MDEKQIKIKYICIQQQSSLRHMKNPTQTVWVKEETFRTAAKPNEWHRIQCVFVISITSVYVAQFINILRLSLADFILPMLSIVHQHSHTQCLLARKVLIFICLSFVGSLSFPLWLGLSPRCWFLHVSAIEYIYADSEAVRQCTTTPRHTYVCVWPGECVQNM